MSWWPIFGLQIETFNLKKRPKIWHLLHFWQSPTLASIQCRIQLNTKKIYIIALDKIYFIYMYQYRFGSCLKWQNSIFLYIKLNLGPSKSSFNQCYPKSVPNLYILIISLPKKDKMLVLAKFAFFTIFPIFAIPGGPRIFFEPYCHHFFKSLICYLHDISLAYKICKRKRKRKKKYNYKGGMHLWPLMYVVLWFVSANC